VIVGTAGHIDHGKTALVKALTGIDADRLEEEKRRGITIDIGFAHLELPAPGGERLRLGFVDVPGHERFVRNMLAGVGGIDLVLLVIAADEGVKPQTREHFDICRLLAVRRGLTVLTKSDLVDSDTLQVVRLEVEDFLRGSFLDASHAPIAAVSSLTGAGLDVLKRELTRIVAETPTKDSSALFRLPIDRVFTVKGFGTVVTGTLISGSVTKEQEVELFPAGKRVRVRGVQVHGSAAEHAIAGQRTAVNLVGVETSELARGMMLAAPGLLHTTKQLDVSLALLPSAKALRDRARVHFHAYTAETIAEVQLHGAKQLAPGQIGYARLRLPEPALLLPGDRFIVRQFSPVVTIGGGAVVDASPLLRAKVKSDAKSLLETLASGNPIQQLVLRTRRRGAFGLATSEAVAETGWRPEQVDILVREAVANQSLVRFTDRLFGREQINITINAVTAEVAEFHKRNPLAPGISKGELREHLQRTTGVAPELFEGVLDSLSRQKKLEISGEQVREPGRGVVLKEEEAESKKTIENAFASAGLQVPALKDIIAKLPLDKTRAQKIVTLLLRDRVLVKVSDDLVFHRAALDDLRRRVQETKTRSPKIDVAGFKNLTGVSRKYAIPLLEYLDRERVTRRVGDERVIL
jgi:selenocysteine-specific elongation factor